MRSVVDERGGDGCEGGRCGGRSPSFPYCALSYPSAGVRIQPSAQSASAGTQFARTKRWWRVLLSSPSVWFVRSFVTTSGTTSRSFPYFGREGRPRRLYSTRTQCSLSTSHTPAWCPCGSHEAQRDFDVRSSRDHPRKVRRPFMPRGSRHRPDIGTPTLFDASSFHHLLSICTSGRDNSSKKQFSFSSSFSSFSFLSNQSNQKCDESSPPLRRFEAKIRARSGARVSKRGSVVIRVERQPAEGIRSRPFPSCPA